MPFGRRGAASSTTLRAAFRFCAEDVWPPVASSTAIPRPDRISQGIPMRLDARAMKTISPSISIRRPAATTRFSTEALRVRVAAMMSSTSVRAVLSALRPRRSRVFGLTLLHLQILRRAISASAGVRRHGGPAASLTSRTEAATLPSLPRTT